MRRSGKRPATTTIPTTPLPRQPANFTTAPPTTPPSTPPPHHPSFARFGSERLNDWLSCTLEEKECVTTGVKQDTSAFYSAPPPAIREFKPSDLEGKWYKVVSSGF